MPLLPFAEAVEPGARYDHVDFARGRPALRPDGLDATGVRQIVVPGTGGLMQKAKRRLDLGAGQTAVGANREVFENSCRL